MIAVAMVVFCNCGSDKVVIDHWEKGRALFRCATCDLTCWVEGFTLGRLDFVQQLCGAILDQARKYRERDPQQLSDQLRERALQRKVAQRR